MNTIPLYQDRCFFCKQPRVTTIVLTRLCARHLGIVEAIAQDANAKPARAPRRPRKPTNRRSLAVAHG